MIANTTDVGFSTFVFRHCSLIFYVLKVGTCMRPCRLVALSKKEESRAQFLGLNCNRKSALMYFANHLSILYVSFYDLSFGRIPANWFPGFTGNS